MGQFWRWAVLGFGLLNLSLGSLAQEGSFQPIFDLPTTVKQGEVIPIIIRHGQPWAGGSAQLGSKTIPLFAQNTGDVVGLFPIGVQHPLGATMLTLYDAHKAQRHSASINITSGKFPIQNVNVSKTTAGLQPLPGELEAVGALKNRLTPIRYWQEPFISPTPDCMNSLFGVLRYHNGKPTGDYHKGVDLMSPMSRPIKATASGKVIIAKMFRLHGGTVGLDHGQGVSSIYIHMSKIVAKEGTTVDKGQIIGYVGSTGFATGPHLHWGMYVNGLPINPNQWIKNVPRC